MSESAQLMFLVDKQHWNKAPTMVELQHVTTEMSAVSSLHSE